MTNNKRRTLLKLLGAAATIGGTSAASAKPDWAGPPKKGRIRKMGHSLLSDPGGGYAEEDIRADGQYALVGHFSSPGGSFLVDISNPTNPTEVHEFPTTDDVTHADVEFDRRNGLYYRGRENGEENGVDVIDYGYGEGTPENPVQIDRIPAGSTHNVDAHPEGDVLYTTEHDGVGVWNTSDPSNVEEAAMVHIGGDCHDIVVDAGRDLLHCAFIGGGFTGYVALDISDPLSPTEAGRFDYAGRPNYTEIGTAGFESCHYASHDPERDLVILGDEIGFGIPGGKHILDIGWGDGSVENPQHIGFTHSPNAQVMDENEELFDWTTHNHTVISKGSNSLLVSGDYHEGTVVYDISDPTDPTPTDQYRTDDKADQADGAGFVGEPPMAWGADYSEERDLVVTSDMQTGLYVFKVTPARSK
ncbi:LVIVD repeat-containing protein [Haladaptatus litoreus]|uniref:LVIVD repeat-containing protein n=2 Tax=Haladaptatus litoreus TaxID=553468 RepID=A0A1N7EHG8_9EURY|nr:LVIVD repeat-containing protein [Haladaptatus litoreus]